MPFSYSEIKEILKILKDMFTSPVDLARSVIIITGFFAGFFVGRTLGWFVGDLLNWGVLADILFAIVIAGCIILFTILAYRIALQFIK